MSKYKMISPAVPNVPWQDKPENHEGAPLWRYTENPVIGRNPVEGVARIFNSAVIPYEGSFILEEVRTDFTGHLIKKRSILSTKKASLLCRNMHTIHVS